MRRRAQPKSDAAGVSLFPFLAVLLCTMGALIVVLVVIARQARTQADRQTPVADDALRKELEAKQADLQWRIEQMRESRKRTLAQLESQREEVGHLEDHARRLRSQLEELDASRRDFDQLASGSGAEAELLKQQIAEAERQLADKRRQLDETRRKAGRKGSSYAVVPYHGPNETRRRPIYIECRSDGVVFQPEGLVLSEKDFEGDLGPSNPLVSALRAAREHLKRTQQPGEGAPYPLLLIRPEGIGAYEAVMAAMSSWGSEYGYELIGQDWPLEYPPPDPQLSLAMRQAIGEARLRQAYLARAAPRLAHAGQHASFRAAPAGGLMRDDGMPVGGAPRLGRGRSIGRPSRGGGSGLGSARGAGQEGVYSSSGSGGRAGEERKSGGNPYRAALASQQQAGADGAQPGRYGAGGPYAQRRGAGGGESFLGLAAKSARDYVAERDRLQRDDRAGGSGDAPGGEGDGNSLLGGGDRYGRAGLGGGAAGKGDSLVGGSGTNRSSNLMAAGSPTSGGGTSRYGGGPARSGAAPGGAGSTPGASGAPGASGRSIGGGRGWGMAQEKLANASRMAGARGTAAVPGGAGGKANSGAAGTGQAAGTGTADRSARAAGTGTARGTGTTAGNASDSLAKGNQPGSTEQGSAEQGSDRGGSTQMAANQRGGPQQGGPGEKASESGPLLGDAASGAVAEAPTGPGGAARGTAARGSTAASGSSNGEGGAKSSGPGSGSKSAKSSSGSVAGGASGAPGAGAAGSGANGGGQSSGGSGQPQQQVMGVPGIPNLTMGQPPQSIAEKRGQRNWANPAANHSSFPITRPIKIVCDAEHLTLLPEGRNRRGYRVIEFDGTAEEGVRDLVESVWDRVETWGPAGQGMYWRPELLMEVEPGGEQRFAQLKALLADSGLDVHGRPRRIPRIRYPRTGTPN